MLLRPHHARATHNREYKEKRVFDSGCSRHITRNKCYLTEYEDYDGGFVSFGDGKGRIYRKGKIKTGTLDFDNVYFCKELKYNLFSVSQIFDKKNNVLFTDTECLFLSSDFKLLDESQVLLRVPRKDNIYGVDLNSIVPTKGLTCLFAKAIIDEYDLWHMRTPQQNGVTKRRNRTPIEDARTMNRDNIVAGPKDSEEDAGVKPTELDESEALDKDGKDDQQQEVSLKGYFKNKLENSLTINAAEAFNAFEEHLFERFSPLKNAFTLPLVSNVTLIDDTGIFGNAYDDEDVGELTFFLGLQVQQKEDGIFISQDKYVAKILKKFDFATVKTASTPIETNKAFVKDEEAEAVDVHLYRSMIGSLMYLTASRHDILFVVCACVRASLTGNPHRRLSIIGKGDVMDMQVQSSDDDLDEEDASEQGRKSDKKNLMFKDSDFDVLDDDMENVERETVNTATTVVSAVSAPVTTAGVAISTAEPRTPPTTAATAFIDEDLTIAQTLVKMRSEKAKEKGVAFRDVEETHRLTRSTTTLQPLPTIDPKDKELSQRLHEEELAELDKAQKEKQKQEEATNAALAEEFDEIQARIAC
ncbi:ribonuclease H-like domain-containing protein [Tanacetum coccineum]